MYTFLKYLMFSALNVGSSNYTSNFCRDLVISRGYACSEHSAQTSDGFIISFQNIPPSSYQLDKTVLLLHPNLWSGDIWIHPLANGTYAPAFLPFELQENGYDVWIANFRATFWGHENIHYGPNDTEYWQWSWDEIAQYDLSSISQYISQIKGENGAFLHIIGFDYGATIGLAGATLGTPVSSLTLIGPGLFMGGVNSTTLREWAYIIGPITDGVYVAEDYNNGEFNISAESANDTSLDFSGGSGQSSIVDVYGTSCCIPSEVVQNFSLNNNGWDGTTSFQNLMHAQQDVRSNGFRKYDFSSPSSNRQHYGTPVPPSYDIENLPENFPVFIVHGGQDPYSSLESIDTLTSAFEGKTTPKKLLLEKYAHYDLLFSSSVKDDVFSPIIEFLDSLP